MERAIALVEWNDLRNNFSKPDLSEQTYNEIKQAYPIWKTFLLRRLKGNSYWYEQSNLVIKEMLDRDFPLKRQKSNSVLNLDLFDMNQFFTNYDLSIEKHSAQLLKTKPDKLCCMNEKETPYLWDYLNLLIATGEDNLYAKVRKRLVMQYLMERATSLLDQYEEVYLGHPDFTILRARYYEILKNKAQGQALSDADKLMKDFAYKAYYWYQGQANYAYRSIQQLWNWDGKRNERYRFYDADFPSRTWWYNSDRNHNLDPYRKADSYVLDYTILGIISRLKYTHSNYGVFKNLHKRLGNDESFRDNIMQQNAHRFIGHPDRYVYLAAIFSDTGDIEKANKLLREEVESGSKIWSVYKQLGHNLIYEGFYQEAQKVFLKYPLFHEPKNESIVTLTNQAFYSAQQLFWNGAYEEAIPRLSKYPHFR